METMFGDYGTRDFLSINCTLRNGNERYTLDDIYDMCINCTLRNGNKVKKQYDKFEENQY